MADKKFEPHVMYDAKKAETHKEHLSLKNKGYGHSPNKIRTAALSGMINSPLKRCWKGYKPNPDGRAASEQGSCVKE